MPSANDRTATLSGVQAQDQIARALGDLVRDVVGDAHAEVESVRALSGGASRETWLLEVPAAPGGRLILRCDPPGLVRQGGIELEAAAIAAAGRAGVPVPPLLHASGDGAPLGRPFMLTEFVDGETVPRRILEDPALAGARSTLARRCGEVLARWHSVPPESVPGLPDTDPLATQLGRLDDLPEPHPVLELGLSWLQDHAPTAGVRSVVHGDFRNGNLIVGPEGLRAVLDWEVVHAGDPYEDLGWLCVRAWRFRGDDPVGGFGTFQQVADGYGDVAGHAVDAARWRWWLVFGTVRWGITCHTQAAKHLRGQVRSVDLVAIGRRASETELDVLDLIEHVESLG